MPPFAERVSNLRKPPTQDAAKHASTINFQHRQALLSRMLNSSLFVRFTKSWNQKVENIAKIQDTAINLTKGQKDWKKLIETVIQAPFPVIDTIIDEVVGEFSIAEIEEKTNDLIEKYAKISSQNTPRFSNLSDLFAIESLDKYGFDARDILNYTWGSALGILETIKTIKNNRPDKCQLLFPKYLKMLGENIKEGLIFLRAVENASKDSRESQDIGISKYQTYYTKREITDKAEISDESLIRMQLFDEKALENEKLDAARLEAINIITGNLIAAGSEPESLSVLYARIADGFRDILPYANIEVEFRSDILSEEYLKSNSENFPVLSQNGKLELLSRIREEPKSVEDVNRKMMGLPLLDKSKKNLLGVIIASLGNGSPGFPNEIKDHVETLNLQSSRMLENIVGKEKLERKAKTDPLTGLMNRLYFEERINQEFTRSQRYHSPLSLLYLDIDFFKKINDSYGHDFGDKVLKEIAEILKQAVRDEVDLPIRWGGEEFAIILPETSYEGARDLAERIRKLVESHEFVTQDGRQVSVTVSIGVSTLNQHSSSAELFQEADQKLYKAKNSGRNKVV